MSIDRGMDKEDMVHTCSGILVIKQNKEVTLVETWVDLRIVIQNEVREESKYGIIFLIYEI